MVAVAEVVGLEESAMAAASVAFMAAAGVGVEAADKKSHVSGDVKCCCGHRKQQEEGDGQQKKSSGKSKSYELVDYDSLPDYLKHNEFILGYYRSNWPWKETLLSVFSIHNETINVWTHLIGFLMFLALTLGTASVAMSPASGGAMRQVPDLSSSALLLMPGQTNMSELAMRSSSNDELNVSSSSTPITGAWYVAEEDYSHMDEYGGFPERFHSPQANGTNDRRIKTTALFVSDHDANTTTTSSQDLQQAEPITRWPFMAFLFGAMVCLLTSSLCHLLCCHSEQCSYIMLRLDYAGISTLIVTSFYPLVYYAFLCHPFYLRLYLSAITASGLAAALVSLIPVFDSPSFRFVRAALFFCMGASSLVPIFHKLVLYAGRPEVLVATAYEMMMGLFYGCGVVVYAARIPERWMPGKFDLAGHSHQLFHVLVVAGAYTHYLAGLMYLQWRDTDRCGMM